MPPTFLLILSSPLILAGLIQLVVTAGTIAFVRDQLVSSAQRWSAASLIAVVVSMTTLMLVATAIKLLDAESWSAAIPVVLAICVVAQVGVLLLIFTFDRLRSR